MIGRDQLEDLIEAYVLDLMDPADVDSFLSSVQHHPDLIERTADLQRTLAGLAYDEHAVAPPGLRVAAFTRAAERRRPGSAGDGATASPVSCHRETVAGLSSLIDELTDGDFAAETIYGIPVIELISHLSGVESEIGAAIRSGSGETSPVTADHVAHVDHRSVRDDGDLSTFAAIVARWHQRTADTTSHVSRLAADRMADTVEHAGSIWPIGTLLVARAFEVWTHADDIRRAIGRPTSPPSASVLRTMAETAIDLLVPLVDRAHAGKSLRLTMTGDGGGSWIRHLTDPDVVATDPDPFAPADATLVTDVVDFCRVVADRCDAGSELDAHRLGDETLLDELLRVAPSLADFGAGPLLR